MPLFFDQLNRPVQIREHPQRIVSLVPSQTELLYDLGLEAEVIGITKFCVHPAAWFKYKKRVGGTKKPDFAMINQLSPDLIIANKEENNKEDIEQLQRSYPVFVTDVNDLPSAYEMIVQLGAITHRMDKAQTLVREIQQRLSSLKPTPDASGKTVLYLIWKDPYMAAGSDTFINEMLEVCGLRNIITDKRYPILDFPESTNTLKPHLIFLSSEPFPFREKHANEMQQMFPHSRVVCVDGEMFSWYGSRLMHAAQYFGNILNHLFQEGVI